MRRFPMPVAAAKVNVTPMIDVVMCLIIFFLIVARMAADRNVPVDLPRAPAAPAPGEGDPLVINLLERNAMPMAVVQGAELSPQAVTVLVRETLATDATRPIILRAERSLSSGQVRRFIEACREGGAAAIQLAAIGEG